MRLEDDCCYTCSACDRATCRDDAPSPGEDERICAECYDTEDSEAVA